MNIKNLTILGTALLGFGLTTITEAAQSPNFFSCIGRNVSLTLAVGSNAEVGVSPTQTALSLNIGKKKYAFQAANIVTESTLIGDLWEVILNVKPDLYVDHASVVIPSVSLGKVPLKFKSQLILTRVETPFIVNAFEGIVNPSKYIDISCTASVVN